jgi:tetratricopeptide (TPR) repeat protein
VAAHKPSRVLLVSARPEEVKTLGGPLARARFAVVLATNASDACDALQRDAFDALLLSLPLPDAEPVGACAALSAVPGRPPIVLIDAVDRSRELMGALPADSRPARCAVRPIEPAKLPDLVREVIEAEGALDASVDRRGFANVLVDLAERAETGVLEVRADGVVTRIFVARGVPASVEGGSLRDTLGRMLVRTGALSEAQYQRVIQRMTEHLIDNEHQRMGEVLIELKLLGHADVFRALSQQAEEKIVECFAAPRVELAFDPAAELAETIERLEIPPFPALLVAAVKRHFSADEQSALLMPIAGARMRLRSPAPDLRLDPEDARIAQHVARASSVAEVWRAKESARGTLAALAAVGALVPRTPQRPAAPEPRPVVPTPRVSGRFTREFVGPRGALPPPGAPASEPAAAGADAAKARLEAEGCFQRARALVDAEKFLEALPEFQRAVALQPHEPEYRMHEAWAAYLAARVAQRIARAKAVACARKMSEADPRAAEPHSILGRLLLDDGDMPGAKRELELALTRDPNDAEAGRALARARGGNPAPK